MMGPLYIHCTNACKSVSVFYCTVECSTIIDFRLNWGAHMLPSLGPHLHHYLILIFHCKMNARMIIILAIIRAVFIILLIIIILFL